MKNSFVWIVIGLLSTTALADEDLRDRIKDEHVRNGGHWIYNDIAEGFRQAKETGKPLFVTFRCVPCEKCNGFDGEVASGSKEIRDFAAKNFVCVRQVEMKGVDLRLFQFDHDLNWTGMFLNADQTIYARYGTQSEKGADAYNSVDGLLTTMKRVLKIHQDYPNNRQQLVAKKAETKAWKTAMDMPTLNPSLRNSGKTTRSNCIHCHNIHDAENAYWEQQGKLTHDRLWRYPLPGNIGIQVDAKDGRTVKSVIKDSAAAEAGVVAGKKINTINGQLVSSIADVQWVLHSIPNLDGQKVIVSFDDESETTIALKAGWKKTDISWRGSLWELSPRLRVWMPSLTSAQRKTAELDKNEPALLIKWINRGKPGGKAAFKSGLREGDILLQVDGKPVPDSPQKLNVQVKLNHKVGEAVPVVVQRAGKRIELNWSLVE
ncbi:MAG: Trx7/PDZ domain-containing (seleno)protein [Planctomycetota bacterium]